MKYSILLAIGLSMVLPLQAAEKGAKGKQRAKANPEKVFNRKDKDNDSLLTKEEFTAKAKDAAKAAERFAKRDKDSDGKLTLAEFKGKKGAKNADKKANKKAGAKKADKKQGKNAGAKKANKKTGNKAGRARKNK